MRSACHVHKTFNGQARGQVSLLFLLSGLKMYRVSKIKHGAKSRIFMRIPMNRMPEHPGEILREDFLKPKGIAQEKLADELGISFQRVNGIVNGKRSVTAETAWLLAGYFGTSASFWLNLQNVYDLYKARKKVVSNKYAARAAA